MNCDICGTSLIEIEVGKSPISGYFCDSESESLGQPEIEMVLLGCSSCKMVKYQWDEAAGAVLDRLYSGHFATYHFTQGMSDYMHWFVQNLVERYKLGGASSVLEIGCNSGRLLALFREQTGSTVLGVEPSGTFEDVWRQQGVEVINGYFGSELAKTLSDRTFDVIFFRHVFEHIPDPVAFFGSVAEICDDHTRVVIEVPYLLSVIDRKRIENISYSHLNYFSIKSINEIAKKFGLGITDFELVETDGGSIILHLQKGHTTAGEIVDDVSLQDVEQLVGNITDIKNELTNRLDQYDKQEVIGYGAGAKGQHLVHMLQLEGKVDYLIDDTPELDGKFVPGTTLEIRSPSRIDSSRVQAVVNLIPTHAQAIKEKVADRFEFIDPING